MESNLQKKGFSNLQLELLKLYALDVPDKNLLEIKSLLFGYFARQADEAMDKIWKEKVGGRRKQGSGRRDIIEVKERKNSK